jgi:OTU domain-containing protein 6
LYAGKIQILKKSVTKGDKKKKKEVTEEITRLELELDKLQNEELLQLKQVGFMTPTIYFIHCLV